MDGTDVDPNSHADWARRIEEAGWRQCSVFRPPEDYVGLPSHLLYAPGRDWLIVCTQSCSVCGDDFTKDPLVEVMLAKELPSLDRSCTQALGRNFRELHIPVEGLVGAEGLACFISRRTQLPREELCGWKPSAALMALPALKAFQGWLAAHYTRIALPNALVGRIRRKGGISHAVKKALKRSIGGSPVNSRVLGFYVKWGPDVELPEGEDYELSLVVACKDETTADALSDDLRALVSGRRGRPVSNGIVMDAPEVHPADAITLAQIHEHMRFNEWDSFSGPEELIPAMTTP